MEASNNERTRFPTPWEVRATVGDAKTHSAIL
jgi:hypothetical protein